MRGAGGGMKGARLQGGGRSGCWWMLGEWGEAGGRARAPAVARVFSDGAGGALSNFPACRLVGLSESWQDRPEGWDELERYVTGERGQHEKVCSYRGASGGWWRW